MVQGESLYCVYQRKCSKWEQYEVLLLPCCCCYCIKHPESNVLVILLQDSLD
jgi:hypothetical protein